MLVVVFLALIDLYAQNTLRVKTRDGIAIYNLNQIESIDFTDDLPEPWTKVNTASCSFALYNNAVYRGVVVSCRESSSNEDEVQYRFTGMPHGYSLVVNCNKETGVCWVPVQLFGVDFSYGPVYVSDDTQFPLWHNTNYQYPSSFDSKTGVFNLNLIYFYSKELGSSKNAVKYYGYEDETIKLDGFENYDYSFTMKYDGKYVNVAGDEMAIIITTKGTDILKYRIALVDAEKSTEEVAYGIVNGKIKFNEFTEAGEYRFPVSKSGNYKAVAVTYDINGKSIGTFETEFSYIIEGENDTDRSLLVFPSREGNRGNTMLQIRKAKDAEFILK